MNELHDYTVPGLSKPSLYFGGSGDVTYQQHECGANIGGGAIGAYNVIFEINEAFQGTEAQPLVGSVLKYDKPLEPIAIEDWDQLDDLA
jgi:hypothetical protein